MGDPTLPATKVRAPRHASCHSQIGPLRHLPALLGGAPAPRSVGADVHTTQICWGFALPFGAHCSPGFVVNVAHVLAVLLSRSALYIWGFEAIEQS